MKRNKTHQAKPRAYNGSGVRLHIGDDVANYAITDQSTTFASITPLSVSVSGVTAANKVYDTNTIATLNGAAVTNTITGDTVTLETNYIANFANKNVGGGISVNVSGFALSGTDAANYSLAQPTGLTADITPAPLVITVNNDSKLKMFGTSLATESTDLQSKLVNDSLVRPRSTGRTSEQSAPGTSVSGWYKQFSNFLTKLFQQKSISAPQSNLVPPDIKVDSSDVFIGTKRFDQTDA